MENVTNSLLPHAFAGQDEQFGRAFSILQQGVEQRAFPGASVAVTYRGALIASKALGRFTYDREAPQVTPESVYDLASLTKVLATTAACMILHQRGQFDLERPVVDVVPEITGGDVRRKRITFRMLLAHSSGLPAYVKLFQTAHNRQELLEQACRIALVHEPGSHAEYSDIGFILLGEALERIAGETLDVFAQREIFSPMRLQTIRFNPEAELFSHIPPTEHDNKFRHRVIQGEVNDENAWAMGGVAGHAGLFSTAYDIAAFAERMLCGGAPLLDLHTVELFTRRERHPADTSRALGWDTPSPPSQSGRYFSPGSYGHLGFTGTSLWIDPQRHLSVTLLTNRTWPDRSAQAIKQIRPAFHDAVVEALQ